MRGLKAWFPILTWGPRYRREFAWADLVAALVVTLMLIPQSLAYALLAGVPPEAGLYASLLPLLAYGLMGSSSFLAVGPAAVTSLMTAAAVTPLSQSSGLPPMEVAAALSLLSGGFLLAMGTLRLGVLAHFFSHPVLAGFVSASVLLIALGQLKTLLGLSRPAGSMWLDLDGFVSQVHGPTACLGIGAVLCLLWARQGLAPCLRALGMGPLLTALFVKMAPVGLLTVSALGLAVLGQEALGITVLGHVPAGLPPLAWPDLAGGHWQDLLMPAVLLSVVGFVESVSVAQSLAAKRREHLVPDQELRALGAANLLSGLSAGFPVTGGFSRSVVNFDAGARTPMAGILTAAGLLVALTFLTPWFAFLPHTVLAATILVSVMSLFDAKVFWRTWRTGRGDFLALLVTFLGTLVWGVEMGLLLGVGMALLAHVYATTRPHIAVVGLVPGTEHFRNVQRHQVRTSDRVLSLRIDESLYFANVRHLEAVIQEALIAQPSLTQVVLQCSAVNTLDATAMETLESLAIRLGDAGVGFHLSEIKGPVMDQLVRHQFPQRFRGQMYLTHYQAMQALAPELFVTEGS